MKKYLILFLVLFLSTPAMAENWTDKIEMGGDVLMRGYYLNNFFDFDDKGDIDNWTTFRLRTRLYTKVNLENNISGYVRLANQTYGENIDPSEDIQKQNDFGRDFDVFNSDNKSNKVFVDNAYIEVKDFFGTGTTFKTGRMDLVYGSGFVLFDGQSQYASTSQYFDGVKLSIPLGDKATLDGLYFKDQENMRWNTKDDDITLYGTYLTAKCPAMGGQQELYLLGKNDENLEKDIWLAGFRLSNEYECGLDYSAEIGYQFGQFNDAQDIDQDSFGGKADVGYTLKDIATTPRLFAGYAFMQGDDPDTKDQERWDVFYGGWPQFGGKIGGWPQFGDLLAWKYVNAPYNTSMSGYDPKWKEQSSVSEEAVFSNLTIASVGIGCKPMQNLSTTFTYSLLTFEEPALDASGNKKDDDFGDYYQLDATYSYSKNLSFSIYAAMIDPGDAFDFTAGDKAYEFFWATNLKF